MPVAVATAVAVCAASAPAAAAPSVRVSAKPVATPLTGKAKTTITVRNAGDRRVRGLTVSVAPVKGVRVALAGARRGALSRTVGALEPGEVVRVRVRLRSARGGPQQGRLRVKVQRKGRTVATTRLAFGGAGPQPGPPPPPPTLTGRYFWGSQYTINGIDQHSLYFTGPDLVYIEATESAWPTCAAVTEACRPYTYDPATNQLTIDGRPATLEGRTLTFDEDTYFEFGFPPAGTRWETHVTYSNSSGICPLFCSYYTENLTFLPDGTFVRDAVSSGTGPIVDWASVPPDSKGTYEVRVDQTLRLAYADGTERIETVALFMEDDGTLQPVGDGLLLGGDGYFDIRDE